MAKKRVFHRSKSFTLPLAAIAGIVASEPVRGIFKSAMDGNVSQIPLYFGHFAGIKGDTGRFDLRIFLETYVPLFMGFGVHWLASRMGVNRALGAAKVPIVRI